MRQHFVALAAVLAAFFGLGALPAPAQAQTGENVLLIINDSSPDSIRVGEHYARARAIAPNHIVRIKAPIAEVITRADYERAIETPIGEWIARHLLHDQILFIVLTKGIPLRVDGSGGQTGTTASVDSELTLLYRKMAGTTVLITGRTANPYFLQDRPLLEARKFSRMDSDIYLVTRLDGFTVDDVLKLIDRGSKPSRDGQIVLDQKAGFIDRGGDLWLSEAANRLMASGFGPRVQLEGTAALASTTQPVLGYFSWGSNDPANQLRTFGLNFSAGAIGGMYVSTDGRTFREPAATWKPAPAGSTSGGQSLVGDLIRDGITGVSASVTEPYLDAIVRPQILFPAYVSGFTLAESYYLAMPYLSWQTVVIGDPLCAPYQQSPMLAAQMHRGIDAEVALPTLFAQRRLAAMTVLDLNRDGIKLQLKALSLSAQGKPEAEVLAALNRAVALEPRLVPAQLLLADKDVARGDYDGAIGRYRQVLKTDGGNVAALNNLAYYLVDKKGAAEEALPFAERAYSLSKQAPVIADTLGWVYFKLNRVATALPLVERAAAALKRDVDVQIHAAAINAAINNRERAKAYLDAALEADPSVGARADVKAILAKIKG
jgi:uncharacterized protein (TIGR03790 family)